MNLSIIISFASLIFCLSAFIYFKTYINKRTSFDGILKDVREEVNRLLAGIDDITNKDITLIEDREKRLKTLLEETDKHLLILNREIERRGNAEKTYREMGRSVNVLANQEIPAQTKPAGVSATAPQHPATASNLPFAAAPAQPASAVNPPAAPQISVPEPQPIDEQIREMTRAGMTPAIIASRLGISVTEAEFAAALELRRSG